MCGLNGIFAYNHSASSPERTELLATRDHMQSRGPDGFGEWWSKGRRIGLGHRRLAIIDTSDLGSQPMVSACGRYTIVFNGEIYNYSELRSELEVQGALFRTASDTEVLLNLYALKGSRMVYDLRGMFAFAIWDELEQGLFLARDPSGIKPLYTANDGWTFRFASQVKSLLAGGRVSRDPEPAGSVGFLLMGSVPEPFTLYRDIRQLCAGHTQYIDEKGPREPKSYFSVAQVLAEGAQSPIPFDEIQSNISGVLLGSVKAHLVADVEVGLFLSSGIDSVALMGLMADAGQTKTKSVTVSFSEFLGTKNDEAPIARSVAESFGNQHYERVVDLAEFDAEQSAIMEAMDQPTIDGINMWFAAKAAREAGMKVMLSGVGGDELFAGYPSFGNVPFAARRFLGAPKLLGLGFVWRNMFNSKISSRTNPKIKGLLDFSGSYSGAYLIQRGLFLPFELNAILDPEVLRSGLRRLRILDALKNTITPDPGLPIGRVIALEYANYMRNQLLRDADWTGMAHGVEIRTPLLDMEVIRTVSRSVHYIQKNNSKSLLANSPSGSLPRAIAKLEKQGFAVPSSYAAQKGALNNQLSIRQPARVRALTVAAAFDIRTASNAGNISGTFQTAMDVPTI
jgi:asparagine synthase (glutamine-hydrolysing)